MTKPKDDLSFLREEPAEAYIAPANHSLAAIARECQEIQAGSRLRVLLDYEAEVSDQIAESAARFRDQALTQIVESARKMFPMEPTEILDAIRADKATDAQWRALVDLYPMVAVYLYMNFPSAAAAMPLAISERVAPMAALERLRTTSAKDPP